MDPVLAIDGMLIQHLDRDVPESGLVRCCQYDRKRNPGFQRLFPAKRAETPPVTAPKAWKPGFGTRCAQVVASRSDHNTLEWEKKDKSEFHRERALAL